MNSCCVFCGSSPGRSEVYRAAAEELGRELAARGIRLIYGGATVGLMGVVADAVLAEGGAAVGVIPRPLAGKEIVHEGLTELHMVESLHERKALMNELSEGFIALPGGMGTLEELLETATWGQLGIHRHPCGVLNVGGYYAPLLAQLDRAVEQGFLKLEHRGLVMVEERAAPLLDRFAGYRPVHVTKWLHRSES